MALLYIQNVFETYNVYRCLLLYDDLETFHTLQKQMMEDDFSFITKEQSQGRVYAISTDDFIDMFDTEKGTESEIPYIEWDTINIVLCYGKHAENIGTYFYDANPGIEYLLFVP